VDAEEDGKYGKGSAATNCRKNWRGGKPVRKDSGGEGGAGTRAREAAEKKQGGGRAAIKGGRSRSANGTELGATAASPDPQRRSRAQRNGILPTGIADHEGRRRQKNLWQAYNAQASVGQSRASDRGAAVTQEANDKQQLVRC